MGSMKCQYDNEECKNEAEYALYRLYNNGTKVWLNLCDRHDKAVVGENSKLKRLSKTKIWREIT